MHTRSHDPVLQSCCMLDEPWAWPSHAPSAQLTVHVAPFRHEALHGLTGSHVNVHLAPGGHVQSWPVVHVSLKRPPASVPLPDELEDEELDPEELDEELLDVAPEELED